MELAKLRQLPHLSASGIGSYVDCGLRYRLSKIDHLEAEFTSDALAYGSTIHRVLENYHEARMHNELLSLSMVLELFDEYWDEQLQVTSDIKFSKDHTAESLLHEGKSLLTTYYDQYPKDDFKVVGVEEPFSFSLPGLPVVLIG